MFLSRAIDSAAPADADMIKAQAVKYAIAAMKTTPLYDALSLILNNSQPDEKTRLRLFRSYAMLPYNAPSSITEVARTPLLTVEQKRSIIKEMQDTILTGKLSYCIQFAARVLNELPE